MSLHSYKEDLLSEINSGYLDPGEEAKLRDTVRLVEARYQLRERIVDSDKIIPLPVEVEPASDIVATLPDDPSAVA